MQLIDLAPLERWIELEKDIHQKSGLDVNVFDTKGYRISELKNWANQLCPAIKATDKGQSFICAPAHMNIATLAMSSNGANPGSAPKRTTGCSRIHARSIALRSICGIAWLSSGVPGCSPPLT